MESLKVARAEGVHLHTQQRRSTDKDKDVLWI